MPIELGREGTDLGIQGKKMIVIFKVGPWHTEEWLSSDKLKDKTPETPDIKGIVDGSGENQLGSSKTAGSNGLCWGVGKEICCSG